jgi:hypothetical protein
VAGGVGGEEAGEELVAEVGGPEEATLVGVVVLVGLVEEDGGGLVGKVVPAVGGGDGAVHGGVQLPQADDIRGGLAAVVEAVVGLGHPLVTGDHELGAVVVVACPAASSLGSVSKPGGKGKVSKQSSIL